MKSTRGSKRFLLWAAVTGVISAGVFLAAAELVALAVARTGGPLLAVGSFIIDIVPQPFKEFAIATFGSNDKVALLAGLGLAVLIAAAIVGIAQYLRPPLGVIGLTIAAVLSGAAMVTRAGAGPLALFSPLAGLVVSVITLVLLTRRLTDWARERRAGAPGSTSSDDATAVDTVPASPHADTGKSPATSRRGFLVLAVGASAAAIVVGVGSRLVSGATSSVEALRNALKLPAPRSTVTVPAGADLGIPGVSALYTSNADFYRVDTALTVPSIDPQAWRLVIDGMVGQRVELSFDDLVAMGLDEYSITLTCVSNEVGGSLLGSAKWLGVPVRDVLKKAMPQSGADMVLSRSVDGFTASTPLDTLTDNGRDAILAVAMNGEPLPLEHGFPVRMVVPGLYGYVSATKWLTELKVTTFAQDKAYWTPRGYSEQAPIKLSSRIDTPRTDAPATAGMVAIGGVAWAQTVGIERVEVSIDDGAWQQAMLSAPVNNDTWVQWHLPWQAEAGVHYLTVRATDKAGKMQTQDRAPIAPDGSSGWQRTLVTVQ